MCGIAGCFKISGGGVRFNLQDSVAGMIAALHTRGPDAKGTWLSSRSDIALGHARLSILDLSESANQPMTSGDGRYTIVYNGEIYNYLELRKSLTELGYSFRTVSDTEVLIVACEHWGIENALKQLIGMFAFALWDEQTAQLYLARDRVGIKPMFFGAFSGMFCFASTLRPFMALPFFPKKLDGSAIASFLENAYIPAPMSIFEGVQKLEPGHYLTVSKDGASETRSFWSVDQLIIEKGRPDQHTELSQYVDKFDTLLNTVIAQHMISDVPLGAFLSGGIDSSLVAAKMQELSSRPVKTFTIGFEHSHFDESVYARDVATILGCEHTEVVCRLDDALALVSDIPEHYDEPFADSSQIPTMLLSKITRQHVTVALSGDGGDELFAGYDRYYWAARTERMGSLIPAPFRVAATCLLGVTGSVARTLSSRTGYAPFIGVAGRTDVMLRLLTLLKHQEDPRYLYRWLPMSVMTFLDNQVCRYDPPSIGVFDNNQVLKALNDMVSRIQYLDFKTYLPDDILQKVDRASMACSLEARVPLLDHRIVEFSFQVPQILKLSDNKGKQIMRQLLYRKLPASLVDRPKHGFSLDLWKLITVNMREWADDLILDKGLDDDPYLNMAEIRRSWGNFLTGRAGHTTSAIWAVLMLLQWRRHYGV
jgi:asparagine synthase (glutamine-hydrolysing)